MDIAYEEVNCSFKTCWDAAAACKQVIITESEIKKLRNANVFIIHIPEEILEELGLDVNDKVYIYVEDDRIIVSPIENHGKRHSE